MNKKLLVMVIGGILFVNACAEISREISKSPENKLVENSNTQIALNPANTSSNANETTKPEAVSPANQTNQPRTVREFFNLLPQKYFTLEGCQPKTDKNCEKARKEYVKTFLEVEDTKNGYWKSGCDGGQSCLTMALFKRPDATYLIHILTEFEMGENSYFLEYKGGQWADISAKVVPDFSQKNTYLPPRVGTTVEVFKKNFPEPDFSERGEKIYNLAWQNGKFVKQ
jgi:hypothetical protein